MGIKPIFLLAILALAAGALGGDAGLAADRNKGRQTHNGAPGSKPVERRLSSAELGALMMARIGRHFVADSRHAGDEGLPLIFYDRPRPFGLWLCRVNVFTVPDQIVRGDKEMHGEDELELYTKYVIWRRPTAPEPTVQEREAGCAAYRDFKHMFGSPEPGPEQRGPYVADVIFEQVRSGHVTIPLTCEDQRPHSLTGTCNALDILRGLTLKELGGVLTKSQKEGDGVTTYEDQLIFDLKHNKQCCSEELLRMTVTSDQHWARQGGDRADPRSAALVVECHC